MPVPRPPSASATRNGLLSQRLGSPYEPLQQLNGFAEPSPGGGAAGLAPPPAGPGAGPPTPAMPIPGVPPAPAAQLGASGSLIG